MDKWCIVHYESTHEFGGYKNSFRLGILCQLQLYNLNYCLSDLIISYFFVGLIFFLMITFKSFYVDIYNNDMRVTEIIQR